MRSYHFVTIVNANGETNELLTLPSSHGPILLGFTNPDNFRAGLQAAKTYLKSYLKATGRENEKLKVGSMTFNAPSVNALQSMISDSGLVHFDSKIALEGDELFHQLFEEWSGS